MTHGGANSILESYYYGKVTLGFPISADQAGGCYRVERMNAGISLQSDPSVEMVVESFRKILEHPETNKYQLGIKRI